MSLKIDSDVNRFKDIVRGKVKSDLKKFVSSEHMLGQQGNRSIRIPINSIDLPRFTFGSQNGGPGMGDGDVGDPMPGQEQPGNGNGKAGNEKGEHDFFMEFSPEDLAKMLGEELQLPDITDKGKGKIGSSAKKYNSINRNGTEGLRHFKRTYKEALKRSISSGNYNPDNPIIIPIKDDKRYKASSTVPQPDVNAAVIYMLDVSGSMSDRQKHIAKSIVFWVDAWLALQYKGIESRFLIHDTEASEVDRQQFFSTSEAGGTAISSVLKYCDKIMKEDYPYTEWNVYPIYLSDGDNWSNDDNSECIQILTDSIIPNCNVFSYGQTTSEMGSGEFLQLLKSQYPNNDKVQTAKIDSDDDILACIKTFLGKGK